MNFRGSKRRDDVTLDMSPMIDVVFLLLIFFLVTATFAQQDQSIIPLDLPEGQSGVSSANVTRTTLIIHPDGVVEIVRPDGQQVTAADGGELEALLNDLFIEAPDEALRLRGDVEASYGQIMGVWDLARRIGFTRVENEIQTR